VAVVVQPGVEFGYDQVALYEPNKARGVTAILECESRILFEAHSTDYQPAALLKALVDDGFAILKVGPALTFALREALYGLDRIASERNPFRAERSLETTMERVMLVDPTHWQGYYHGQPHETRLLRHFSYSDRIRYYWPTPVAKAAVAELIAELDAEPIPETLISQFLPRCYEAVRERTIAPTARALVAASIRLALCPYADATEASEQRPQTQVGEGR
jgi:D-tagatose 6-phosphate 4-epimerase